MIKKIVGLKVLILPLAVAFTIMFTVLFVKPAYDAMMAAKKDVAANARQMADLRSQNAKLAELKSKWETMEEKKLVQTALPESEEVDNYMSELYGRVTRSGVLLTKFETTKSGSSEKVPYVCGASEGGAAPVAPDALAASSASGTAPAAPASCANLAKVGVSVSGNWEQILDLFKNMEDTNRLANISKIAITSKSQTGQEASTGDLLGADITLNIFYKPKSETTSASAISGLASGGRFSEEGLKKLKNVVSSTFEEPGVSEVSERNIFK